MKQTHRIELAAAATQDIKPIGSGTIVSSAVFIDRATQEHRSVPDGAITYAVDAQNNRVFRVTAPAGGLDGWIHFEESAVFWPDSVTF